MAAADNKDFKLESVYIHTLYDILRRIEPDKINLDPFSSSDLSILDHMLGEVPSEVRDFCLSTMVDDTSNFTYLKLFYIASHVLGNPIQMIRRYCVLNRNEREAEEESKFLWTASSDVTFAPSMVRTMFNILASNYYVKYRSIADAVFTKTVHLILSAFENKVTPKVEIPNIEPLMAGESAGIIEKLLTGDIPHYSRFVHEVVRTHFDHSEQDEHIMKPMLMKCMLFTSVAAIDASSRSVLKVALVSASYIKDVFIPYVNRYYFNEQTPTYNLAATWKKVEVYYPSKVDFVFPSTKSEPAVVLKELITSLPTSFWDQIEEILMPSENEMTWLESPNIASVVPPELKCKFAIKEQAAPSQQKFPSKRQRI